MRGRGGQRGRGRERGKRGRGREGERKEMEGEGERGGEGEGGGGGERGIGRREEDGGVEGWRRWERRGREQGVGEKGERESESTYRYCIVKFSRAYTQLHVKKRKDQWTPVLEFTTIKYSTNQHIKKIIK